MYRFVYQFVHVALLWGNQSTVEEFLEVHFREGEENVELVSDGNRRNRENDALVLGDAIPNPRKV
jgi:hypothetical protein